MQPSLQTAAAASRILAMISTSNGQRSTHTPHSTHGRSLDRKPRVPLFDLLDPPGRDLIQVPDHPPDLDPLRTRQTVLTVVYTKDTSRLRLRLVSYSDLFWAKSMRLPPQP